MNKKIYENNMKSLENKYPDWAEYIKENYDKEKKVEVTIEESLTEKIIFKVKLEDKTLYLNGKYAPEMVVEEWLEDAGKISAFATIVIIGLGNGMHIKRIMESIPSSASVLVYEPSYDVFSKAMEEVDLSFIFQPDIPVGIIVEDINGGERTGYFEKLLSYDNMVFLKTYVSGNYIELFEKEVGKFIHELKYHVYSIHVGWNTNVRYTTVNAMNIFYNIRYFFDNYSAVSLYEMLPPEVPTIIVSAGPSLNKNIKELKKAIGKACIIATDTAMKPLLNAGIFPDFFVVIDGLKPGILFEHKDISKVPMITMTAVSIESMALHEGKKFFYMSGAPLENEIILHAGIVDEKPIRLYNIPTGGSVATSAFSMGVFMGSKTLILVGQDLALTDNRSHADGTFQKKMEEINMEDTEYPEVEGTNGDMVKTRHDLKLYLSWFERVIENTENCKVVDATEGGALIHGAKNMTLSDAIQTYCKTEFDIKNFVDECPKLFGEKGEKKAIDNLLSVPKRLEKVKKQAKRGMEYYEKLLKLSKKKNVSQQETKKLFKKIKKINDFMENDTMAVTAADSMRGIEFGLRPLIYEVQEDSKDELEEIGNYGKTLLTVVMGVAEELHGMAEEMIIPFAEEKKAELEENGE